MFDRRTTANGGPRRLAVCELCPHFLNVIIEGTLQLGSNKIWIAIAAAAIVVLGGWFFMSGGDEAEGTVSEPSAIEGSDTAEDQGTDEEEDAAEQADGDN